MQSSLPTTGTAKLLDVLSPFIPDPFINTLLAGRSHPGPRQHFSAAQLWRIHLLALLTPAHSFNALVRLLPEQRDWRRFAHLHHRHRTPDVRMLYEFRERAGATSLRAINEHLVKQLLPFLPTGGQTVAIIDATDLPAATADKKKTVAVGPPNGPRSGRARSKPAIPGSLSVTKSIRCVCGCAVMSRRCCWCRWSVGPRRRMCRKAIYSRAASGNAGSVWAGVRTSSWATWATFSNKPKRKSARPGKSRW